LIRVGNKLGYGFRGNKLQQKQKREGEILNSIAKKMGLEEKN
jgi:hypothetical protein